MDTVPIGRRLKAARQLADITVDELASRLDLPGLGAKTIGNIERGDRDIRPHEVEPIARVLEVPASFLVGDNPAGQPQLEGELAGILQDIKAQLARQTEVLEEIRGYAADAKRMLEEQRALKGQTDELFQQMLLVAQGSPQADPESSPRKPRQRPRAKT